MAAKADLLVAARCEQCGILNRADLQEAAQLAGAALYYLCKDEPGFDPTVSLVPSAAYVAGIRDVLAWMMGRDRDQHFQRYLDALGRIREDMRP